MPVSTPQPAQAAFKPKKNTPVLAPRNTNIGGTNTKAAQSTDGQRLTKIDRENEVAPPPKVDMSVGKAIAKARSEKTPPLKQADLAQKVNEKPSVINGIQLQRLC